VWEASVQLDHDIGSGTDSLGGLATFPDRSAGKSYPFIARSCAGQAVRSRSVQMALQMDIFVGRYVRLASGLVGTVIFDAQLTACEDLRIKYGIVPGYFAAKVRIGSEWLWRPLR
jgi:hypothetical protein